jgi:aminopeptidase N
MIAAACAALHGVARADTYPRQPGIDVFHYIFRVALGDTNDEIDGEATVSIKAVSDGVRDLSFDLASPAGGKGMTVAGVTATLPIGRFTHAANRLRIAFAQPLRAGADAAITVRYHGTPLGGLRFLPNLHGQRVIFSENWPDNARHWLPTVDHPYDKATGELIVTAPAHYQVIANGLLVEATDLADGRRRTHWRQSAPIATWLYALGVARFSVHHAESVKGVPLQTWVFPEDAAAGQALFEPTSRRALEFFAERIAPYPYEKLANVQATGLSGATEHATAIFYDDRSIPRGRVPVVHEIAHQWWGNSVTERDWDDVWLSEGSPRTSRSSSPSTTKGATPSSPASRAAATASANWRRRSPAPP